jgi:tetratricopeptide (TPR) repeat protein
MKKIRDFIIAILIITAVGLLIFYIYDSGSKRENRELARRIAELSSHGGPPETIEGLIRAIELYKDQHERNIKEAAQTGVYWKILAMRYADRNMHNNALEALEWAIYYNGEDPFLFYLRGISAAEVAKNSSGISSNEKERYFEIAERAYLRALEFDITYTRAMYGLGVLYAFELNRPDDAIVQLERFLQIRPSDIDAMAILAYAHYINEDFSRAIDLYDRIANRTNDSGIREEALNNKIYIQGLMYE